MQIISERTLKRIDRAVENGKIIPFLALATLAIALIAGVAANFLAPAGFDGLGDALWWAAQTVTTVGYGDVVPATGGGRFIAAIVMFASVATVSLVTAVVTAGFVAYQQRRLSHDEERHQELRDALHRIEQRLEALER